MLVHHPLMPLLGEPRQRRTARACTPLQPGEAQLLADIEGPGVITRLWFAVDERAHALVLRCYWEDEQTPSVDVPLLDFFGGGRLLVTPALTVALGRGLSAHFPMPFLSRARLELVNVGPDPIGDSGALVQVDYDVYRPEEMRDSPGMFHAQWNRENPATEGGRRFCFARARGHGAFIGATVQIRPERDAPDAWREAAGDMHFVDGEGRPHLLAGTRAGHYFGVGAGESEFAGPHAGVLPVEGGTLAYRFHHDAPIAFRDSLVSLLGAVPGDYRAVSYWYQHEPHRDFVSPVNAASLARDAHLPPGARELPPRPQDRIEWLCGDGSRKVVSRHFLLDLGESHPPGAGGQAQQETVEATFDAPTTRSGQLYVSYQGHIKVIHNGRLVFERDRTEGFGVDPIAVMIPAGENKVRLETTRSDQGWEAPWAVGFRVANSEGRTIEEMEFRTHAEIPEGPAR